MFMALGCVCEAATIVKIGRSVVVSRSSVLGGRVWGDGVRPSGASPGLRRFRASFAEVSRGGRKYSSGNEVARARPRERNFDRVGSQRGRVRCSGIRVSALTDQTITFAGCRNAREARTGRIPGCPSCRRIAIVGARLLLARRTAIYAKPLNFGTNQEVTPLADTPAATAFELQSGTEIFLPVTPSGLDVVIGRHGPGSFSLRGRSDGP